MIVLARASSSLSDRQFRELQGSYNLAMPSEDCYLTMTSEDYNELRLSKCSNDLLSM
jgi:hypothetical protein